MFVTIRRYQGRPGQTEETMRRVKGGLLPILVRQPGFSSYTALDAGSNVAVSVSAYTTRAAAEAANQAAGSWVKSNLTDLVSQADVTVGDVLIAETIEKSNVALVRRGYDAYSRGDIATVLSLLDEQVTWRTPGPPDLPIAGTRRGPAQVAQFFELVNGLVETQRFDARQFIAQGDSVVVTGDETVRVRATGRLLDFQWAHAYTVRAAKIVAFDEFIDLSELVADLRTAQQRA